MFQISHDGELIPSFSLLIYCKHFIFFIISLIIFKIYFLNQSSNVDFILSFKLFVQNLPIYSLLMSQSLISNSFYSIKFVILNSSLTNYFQIQNSNLSIFCLCWNIIQFNETFILKNLNYRTLFDLDFS